MNNRSLSSCGSEAALATLGLCEIVGGDEGRPFDPLKQELGHPVSGSDPEQFPAVVHQNDTHLTAVIAVDDAGKGVDSMTHGQPAAGPDEPDVAGRELQPEASGDRMAISWLDLDGFARAKISPSGVRGAVGR